MTESKQPFRMLLCGRNPEHIQAVTQAFSPEVEVSHQATTLPEAIKIISSLSEHKISLILMGGGFSPSDYQAAIACHPDARSVPWLRPDPALLAGRPAGAGAGAGAGGPVPTPPAHIVAARAKKCLDEHIQGLKEGKGAGEVWYF